jgi:hypothetical protein
VGIASSFTSSRVGMDRNYYAVIRIVVNLFFCLGFLVSIYPPTQL